MSSGAVGILPGAVSAVIGAPLRSAIYAASALSRPVLPISALVAPARPAPTSLAVAPGVAASLSSSIVGQQGVQGGSAPGGPQGGQGVQGGTAPAGAQ